jgi:hypothetical protein
MLLQAVIERIGGGGSWQAEERRNEGSDCIYELTRNRGNETRVEFTFVLLRAGRLKVALGEVDREAVDREGRRRDESRDSIHGLTRNRENVMRVVFTFVFLETWLETVNLEGGTPGAEATLRD